MNGRLFTDYFLTDGIKETAEWQDAVARPEILHGLRDAAADKFDRMDLFDHPNEATTEQELVRPVLEALGWENYLPQQGTASGEDVPDHLLFADSDAKNEAVANPNPSDRYRHATVVQESKRLWLPLDNRESGRGAQARNPHSQILRYLSVADDVSGGRIRWGILTNGARWRIYDYRVRPRATAFYEADLEHIIKGDREDDMRIFYLMFRRDSFILQDGATSTFLETALLEGQLYEERVAQDLSSVVFNEVFPNLVSALADRSDADLETIHSAALILLYRILFVLYAEDRGLLPVNDKRYATYGTRAHLRDSIRNIIEDEVTLSSKAAKFYIELSTLFEMIDKGDDSIGFPAYNGGLFSTATAPLLSDIRVPDSILAPTIYTLSYIQDADGKSRFVNYRDMSVQQLGSIYERLLERLPVRMPSGRIVIQPNTYARKDSGSFFTPQELVDLIVENTLKPLVEERLKAFEDKAAKLKDDQRSIAERRAELEKVDPAETVLKLTVLDPAMGSGHFLVTAVDFLSDYITELLEYVPVVPDWLDDDDRYISPLVARVNKIRLEIKSRATQSGWAMNRDQLTDQAIIRRMVLKRCIYGVDKNSLTVELAKVSLWLHSFTTGMPLSFLDHHIRCGDSLVGLRVTESTSDLNRLGGLFASSAIADAEAATETMQKIEAISDADIDEVQRSVSLFESVEASTAEIRTLMNFLCGVRWLTAGMRDRERVEFEKPIVEVMEKLNGKQAHKIYKLLANGGKAIDQATIEELGDSWIQLRDIWDRAQAIAQREHFFHWEVAFLGVWKDWLDDCPEGGFDAIIGNPPWDKIKLQEVEWFATRAPEIAHLQTAAARREAIQNLKDQRLSLAAEFEAAKEQSDSLSSMVRSYGDYPLLGRGDINLYSLFVERSTNLIKPDGLAGLLTPSGIYADRTAADFFKMISTSGRLQSMFDFDNRKRFFKDVISSFKFCNLTFGGTKRLTAKPRFAFFLHDTEDINDPERCFSLNPDDFARVNPNTGTAPIFRTRRDAEITRAIYERHPVLVDRSSDDEKRVWPVRYYTMFHMTNDSHLFCTSERLKAEGFYPVQGNRWRKGVDLYLPLYQGRMINQFDHRANSVSVNPQSTHNPYVSVELSDSEHADPECLSQPIYWVSSMYTDNDIPEERGYALGFRDIARSTDMRTVIASIVPRAGFGNTLPILVPNSDSVEFYLNGIVSLATCLNSFAFDFVARQKVQQSHLNWFIVEQLPVIAPEDYERRFGAKTAREIVQDHVLRLTYTAHDMKPFALDLGYKGEPFIWDPEERRHLKARLDALYFHLYGISNEDAEYILDTFPIVRREDEAEFGGRYRTRDLVMAYMNALSAGDTESVVAV